MDIKELEVKYDNEFNLICTVKKIHDLKLKQIKKYGLTSIITSVEILEKIYDVHHLSEEYTFVFAIKGNHLLGIYQMSKGTDCTSEISPRMIFRFLLLAGANSFILAHNHPNGDSNMSEEDFKATVNLIKASEYMDFKFINHIIIGKDDFDCIIEDCKE